MLKIGDQNCSKFVIPYMKYLAGGPPRRVGSRGRWTWGSLRQAIGGAVGAGQFRRVVDGLLAEGLVLEVYEAAGDRSTDRRTPKHLLVLPERWREYVWGDLVEARGRYDVLDRLNVTSTQSSDASRAD